MSSNMFSSKSSKTESMTSLIPRGLKDPSQFLSWGSKGSSGSAQKSMFSSSRSREDKLFKVRLHPETSAPKSDSDFAKKAKENGWNAPTAARPSFGGF
ncbi:hypothetical protein E1B28_012830 [Marasmius oreades]|uniref:Uncharacterized protein n=1 Tax=Marasmius oreades TaxID=181124 RepID=A0A9P7RSX6_9AGAR|nr:uncharacterized protein E1B28_012830 [Marasmius oreades]KAG7088882.1 hypothetical protein E1B28_012830 [Marasmius oreades]